MHKPQADHRAIAQSLLKKLIYFDIFSYPLLEDELVTFCDYPGLRPDDASQVLKDLTEKGLVYSQVGYYFLGHDACKIEQRREGNLLASKRMVTARWFATIIANFPFVRAIFISGSLSKNIMKPDSDIDFFIVTRPGRLWLCRAMLTIFKKIFLANSHRNFCINYFIDSNSLAIPDRNLFTATEIAFLLPMHNHALYLDFLKANEWYRDECPNMPIRPAMRKLKVLPLGRAVEFIFDNQFGNWLEAKCFLLITGFWKKKFRHLSPKSYSLNLRSLSNVSKHHPNAFQEYVLIRYAEEVSSFELTTGYPLVTHARREAVNE